MVNYAFKPTAEQALCVDCGAACRSGLTRRWASVNFHKALKAGLSQLILFRQNILSKIVNLEPIPILQDIQPI